MEDSCRFYGNLFLHESSTFYAYTLASFAFNLKAHYFTNYYICSYIQTIIGTHVFSDSSIISCARPVMESNHDKSFPKSFQRGAIDNLIVLGGVSAASVSHSAWRSERSISIQKSGAHVAHIRRKNKNTKYVGFLL